MAVGVGTDDCTEFKKLVDYDPWVVPHQLLPAIATLIGIQWREVIIIMYAWETLEVIFLNCLKISDKEHAANALISDPVQCFVGIILSLWLMRITKSSVVTTNFYRAYLWGMFFILPGIPIIIGDDYVWIYLPLFLIWLLILYNYDALNYKILIYIGVHSAIISGLIFALRDIFNSFYIGILAAFFTMSVSTLIEL